MKSLLHRHILLILLPMILHGSSAFATDVEPGVARISFLAGDVSTMRGDSGDWTAAAVNAPLVRGDKITTGSKARVEIQLDYANVLRVAGQSNVKLADLDQNHIQIQISDGLLNFAVFKGSQAEVEINTPNVAIRPVKEGVYRIEVNDRSETELIIRKGEAEVSTTRGSQAVKNGQSMMVKGLDDPLFQIAEVPNKDSWDDWNADRDNVIKDAQSYRYANNYYTGIQDLDRYGEWDRVPGYDWVWSPVVDDYWAPYQSGRWVWAPYWGWTWCSYEPWGWAPYHYGRWFPYHNRWYWWPGPYSSHYRPMWAPAYVSFIGFGYGGHDGQFGFGLGYNSIGWMPVGPGDYYHPWWGHQYSYNRVEITNITSIRNEYNSYSGQGLGPLADGRRYPRTSNIERVTNDSLLQRSVTTVSSEDFGRGRVAGFQKGISAGQFKDAQLLSGTVPVVPTKESLKFSDSPARLTTSSMRAEASQRFFTRRDPPASLPSFQSQAAAVQQMIQAGNPAAGTARAAEVTERARVRSDNSGVISPSAGNSSRSVQSVSRGQTSPSASPPPAINRAETPVRVQKTAPTQNDRSGWKRFGSSDQNGSAVSSSSIPPGTSNSGSRQVERVSTQPNSGGIDRSGASPRYPVESPQSLERSVAPQYQPRAVEPPHVEKPQLKIERPVVTERSASHSNGGGNQPARSAAPSAPSPSSSDHGGRGQNKK
jgi:hypothetical protein